MTNDAAAARMGLDTTVSHSARIWNYWLGGKDNFAVDREAGDKVAEMLPIIVTQAVLVVAAGQSRGNGWLCRAVLPVGELLRGGRVAGTKRSNR